MKKFLILFCTIFFNLSNAIEVNVVDNTFYVHGNPYYMRGICYHPVPIGKIKRDFWKHASMQQSSAKTMQRPRHVRPMNQQRKFKLLSLSKKQMGTDELLSSLCGIHFKLKLKRKK